MIAGAGGNIAVQIGPDGVLLVDTGAARMTDRVMAEIRKLTSLPVRFIINSRRRLRSTLGGNEELAKAAMGIAVIIGTEKLFSRSKMSAPTGKQGGVPAGGVYYGDVLPEGLSRCILIVRAFRSCLSAAHSGWRIVVVFFRRSDVIVAGEIFDTAHFPVIDVEKGGGIQQEIDALNQIVELAIPSIPMMWQEGGTYMIPGGAWMAGGPGGCGGVSRHGDDYSRCGRGHDCEGDDAGAGAGGESYEGVSQAIRV